MYSVSKDFKEGMVADRREVGAKLVVDYTSPKIDQSVEVETSERATVSYAGQVADGLAVATHKWASLDGSWTLDGSYHLAPRPDEAVRFQFGWWGAQLAGAGGAFVAPYPALTIRHIPRPIHTLSVVGDHARGEWPVDFTIQLYGPDDTLLDTIAVTGNETIEWRETLPAPVLDVARQGLTITRWSEPGRQVKIVEFYTSIQETYYTDDLVEISLLEEREAHQGSLPFGNITANEIAIRIANEDDKFSVNNDQSPLANLLKPNRRIRAWLGAETQVPVGHEDEFTGVKHQVVIDDDNVVLEQHQVPGTEPTSLSYVDDEFEGQKDGVVVGSGGLGLELRTASNMLANPSFEDGKTGWASTFQAGLDYWVVETSSALYGSKCLRLPGGGAHSWRGVGQIFSNPVVGKTYIASVYAKCDEGTNYPVSIRIRVSTNGGQTWGEGNSATYSGTAWERLSCGHTVSPGVNALMVDIYGSSGNPASKNVYIDAAQLEIGDALTPFHFPGEDYYGNQGSYLSPPLFLSSLGTAQSSTITWTATTPTDTSVTIQVGMSTSPTTQPTAFTTATKGGAIPGVAGDLTGKYLWVKAILETESVSVSPRLEDITVSIVGEKDVLLLVYYTDGHYTTSTMPIDGYARIYWEATTPSGTIITAEASLDDGPWQDIQPGDKVEADALQVRVKLDTADVSITPELSRLYIDVYPRDNPVYRLEYVPLGTFWSIDWDSPDDAMEAQVRARDRVELLRNTTYQTSVVRQSVSLYDLAQEVLQDAELEPYEYSIDPALQSIIIPWAWFAPTDHREALRTIAEAGLAVVYADRDGVVRIESMAGNSGATALEITADDYYPPLMAPSRQDQVANEVVVVTQPLKLAGSAVEVYRSSEPITVPAGQTVTVTVRYNQPPVTSASASLDSPPAGLSITSATYYAWGAEVGIRNTGGSSGNVILIVSGKPLDVKGGIQVTRRDDLSIVENGVLSYEFPTNHLVQTLAQAEAIALAILASAKDPRRDIEVEWRGNPAVELGDRVDVAGQDVRVIRQEIHWAGALGARLVGRRTTE